MCVKPNQVYIYKTLCRLCSRLTSINSQTNSNNPNFSWAFLLLVHYCLRSVWWCNCTFVIVLIFYFISLDLIFIHDRRNVMYTKRSSSSSSGSRSNQSKNHDRLNSKISLTAPSANGVVFLALSHAIRSRETTDYIGRHFKYLWETLLWLEHSNTSIQFNDVKLALLLLTTTKFRYCFSFVCAMKCKH